MADVLKTELKKSLLDELRKEIKAEIAAKIEGELNGIRKSLNELTNTVNNVEKSQKFVTKKYDDIVASMQATKRQEQGNKTLIDSLENQITAIKSNISELDYEIHDIQQYLRRDCIEITGIPKLQSEDPKTLVQELANHMDITLKDEDLSVVHRLPDTKMVKNRIIAKFVRREKKDEIYNSKKKCQGKSVNILPSVNGTGQHTEKIYINESLSSRRKKLFNKVYQFKKANSYKYV